MSAISPDESAIDLASLGLSCTQLFDEVPCWISIQDRDHNMIKASRKLMADFGEHRLTKCYSLYKGRRAPCEECVVARTFEDGKDHTSQQMLFDKRGLPHDVLVTTRPLRNERGEIVAVMKTLADISSEKELASRLRDSLSRFHHLFDHAPCFITVQDRDLRILEANDRFKASFGESLGRRCHELYKRRPDPCPECPVAETFADGKVHTSEEILVDNQGREVHVLVYTAPMKEITGEITSVMEMATDVTEMRTLQNKLASLGQLVGGIAHNAKNILEGLRGGVYVVNLGFRDNKQEDIRTGWDMVQRNVGRLSSVILDMLYCARERSPRRLPISLPKLLQEVAALFASRTAEFRIKLELQADEPLEIFGEPKDIHSLVSNLITNAIDACNADQDEQKAHRVTVRAYHDKDDTVVEVEDDGVGMDSVTRNALFKGMVSTKGNSGTGLGLLMAQKVATEHGGSIKVVSELGKGSVFTVRLPVRQQDATST
jgi:PAS domain S-box-containing protein